VLNQLVEQAQAANTDLRAASANLQKPLAVASEVNAEAGPHAAVSASAERARISGQSMLLEEPLPVTNLGDEGIRVAYQLDLFGKLKRGEEGGRSQYRGRGCRARPGQHHRDRRNRTQLLQICSANHGYQVVQQQYGLQQKQLELTRVWPGRAVDRHRRAARQGAGGQRACRLPAYLAQRDAARYRLAMLLGKTPGEALPPLRSCAQEPQLAQAIPVGDGRACWRAART
jgi:outer membrane protein TolC